MRSEQPNLFERIDQGRVKFELLGTPQSLARLDRFVVFARLGAGGMGIIYHAYDPRLDRGVAIKLLRPAVTAGGAHRRLLREARAMARLAHPHVVQVFEVGELEGHIYLVMEYVAGQTLRAWSAASPRSWLEAVAVFIQVADGLAATHAHGLVHCDFKPENVLIGDDGRARVGDFGLVQAEADAPAQAIAEPVRARERAPETTSTSTSLGGGTPRYMAPEQHERRAADARSDQYSFCAALLEALAPAQFESFVADAPLGARALRGEVPAIAAIAGAPAQLGRVVARGLEPDPERRWPSMAALRAELARLVEPPRSRASGWRWALAAGVVLGLLAGVGYGFAAAGAPGCDGGGDQIAAVWGPPQRQRVRAAIAATGLGFAAETGARIEAHLDAHVEAWHEAHRAACEAHRDGQMSAVLLDRTMQCLAADRAALAALVQRLAETDGDELERAMGATLALPELAGCRDAQVLLAQVAPPADAATTLAVHAELSRLAAARTEWLLGHVDVAVRHAAEALARAQAIGYAPLTAQALYHLGNYHYDSDARAATLTRAAWLAAEVGDDERLGLAAAALAYVAAASGDRWSEARTWVQLARAMTHRSAPHGQSHFIALFASGSVEARAGRPDLAGEWFARALAHAEQHLGPRHASTLQARGMVALTLGERGEYDAALAQFERLTEVLVEVFGPSHPDVATHHNNRAVILRGQSGTGRDDEILAEFSQALAIWRAAYGPDHPDVGLAHANIASTLLDRGRPGDLELAEPHLRRAIAIHERSSDSDDLNLTIELANLGYLHMLRLELEEAERQTARALAICERTVGGEHPRAVLPLTSLAEVAGLRGDVAAQRRYYRRALKIQESTPAAPPTYLATTLRGLAEVAIHDGELEDAERLLARAAAAAATAGEDEEGALASLALRGQLALRRGDVATACDLLGRSLRGREHRAFDSLAAGRSSELARALMAAGRTAEARPLAEQAAAFYRRGGPALAWRVDALEALADGRTGYTHKNVRAE
ncbi:serine/threonine-protein kinase [Nannocystis radixulma]|uniref:Serine/threonine-protein kinase n=1 Tax=Nannocystis radixulma TaxID=2995305 RepID=A0ABT5BFD0_9BACT|nr:serine/threonine-protein kinase [Nannocystis radixulma]MDC0672143.1 serine/threonine-protein kinase [Nannocystis radixulma]